MGWTTPRTWTVGEVVTDAMLNEQVRDNENWLKSAIDAGLIPSGTAFPSSYPADGGLFWRSDQRALYWLVDGEPELLIARAQNYVYDTLNLQTTIATGSWVTLMSGTITTHGGDVLATATVSRVKSGSDNLHLATRLDSDNDSILDFWYSAVSTIYPTVPAQRLFQSVAAGSHTIEVVAYSDEGTAYVNFGGGVSTLLVREM